MKVLVACEESQRVCIEFRKRGHIAFSCDIKQSTGGHPEWHIQEDVTRILSPYRFMPPDSFDWYYGVNFITESGRYCEIHGGWDLIIAHPPCTYFRNATMVNLGRKDHPEVFNEEWKKQFYAKRNNAFDFVKTIWNANCDKIVIENVVGYLNTHFMKPTQIIQPFMFGEPYRKATCLWIKGLSKLEPTNIVKPTCKWVRHYLKSKNDLVGYEKKGVLSATERSKTFRGVEIAMAEQWGGKSKGGDENAERYDCEL